MAHLDFTPVLDQPELVASPVFDFVKNWQGQTDPRNIEVAEINPDLCGGEDLCQHYDIDPLTGANCLIVEAKRRNEKSYCACLAPVGFKMDLGGLVRRHLGARVVSMAPLDVVLSATQMEHGSVTPIGLPQDWKILLDASFANHPLLIVGGGLKKSKLRISFAAMMEIPNLSVLEGLGKERGVD